MNNPNRETGRSNTTIHVLVPSAIERGGVWWSLSSMRLSLRPPSCQVPFNSLQESYLSPLSLSYGSTLTYAIKMTSHPSTDASLEVKTISSSYLGKNCTCHISETDTKAWPEKNQSSKLSSQQRQVLGYRYREAGS